MNIKKIFFLAILFLLILTSCNSGKKGENSVKKALPVLSSPVSGNNQSYKELIHSIVTIESYDGKRFLNKETAFYIDSNLIVCRMTPFLNATKAKITPWDKNKSYNITKFVAVDRTNNLIILKVQNICHNPIKLVPQKIPNNKKITYPSKPQNKTILLHNGKNIDYITIEGSNKYTITNILYTPSFGSPVFLSPNQCIGLGYSRIVDFDKENLVTPSFYILNLLKNIKNSKPLKQLISTENKEISKANSKIKGLLIKTDIGDIKIKLFNSTPSYRDNFISLTREGYYNNLLIHRVMIGFGIQSGAADTRYAGKDDIVGWKGPGYTLPAHIVPGLFHMRGMIGSPRMPDKKNSKFRSDGSQFYIVTGRRYSDSELNDLEKEKHIHFTSKQRQIYKTIGGAPYLDGTYTIFGKVISGMDIADKISKVDVDKNYRPLKDIRIKTISIIK